jgi:hypothetical protein
MFTEITPDSHYKDQTFLCTQQNRPHLWENRTKYANHSVGKNVLDDSPGDFAKWRQCLLTSTRLSGSHWMDCPKIWYFFAGFDSHHQPRLPHCWGFAIALRHTTIGRTPLDEESTRCKNLYLTSHNNHRRHRSMPPRGFEPAIPAILRPRIHASDRKAIGIGEIWYHWRHLPKSLQKIQFWYKSDANIGHFT